MFDVFYLKSEKCQTSLFSAIYYSLIWFKKKKQALEKNQQWLVYNEQREAYVRSIVVHTRELEQQVAQTKETKAEATAGETCKVLGRIFVF